MYIQHGLIYTDERESAFSVDLVCKKNQILCKLKLVQVQLVWAIRHRFPSFLILRLVLKHFWTNLWSKTVEKVCWTYFTHPTLPSSDFLISHQYWHHRSKNYILLLINVGRGNKRGCFWHPPISVHRNHY